MSKPILNIIDDKIVLSIGVLKDIPDGTLGESKFTQPVIDKLNTVASGGQTTDASLLTSGILSNDRLLDIPQSKIVNLVTALASKATPADITNAVNSLVDGAPLTLDTLNELAAAINDDPNFATTITNALAGKVNNTDVLNALTEINAGKVLDARQGKVLNDLITGLQTDKLENITGLITNGTNISITGTGTTGNPYVITASGGASGGQVDSVASGTGISVNSTDPVNPVVNLNAGSIASLGLADTASQPGHTHTASNITDFDTEVSNNTDVASNTSHKALTNNPHSVTKAQVGLPEVDNVSAISLRDRSTHTGSQAISTVTGLQTELNEKLESIDIADFETSTELNSRDTANRSRTNHTGTQTASTISDFQTTVSANSDVTANTAKTSNATHTGDVTGSGALSIESAIERESNTVLFDNMRGYIIGNAAARTGNVLFDFTGAKLGCVVLMKHQDAGAFTIPSEGERQNDKPLSTTVVNNIMFWLVDDTPEAEVVYYTVTQEVV